MADLREFLRRAAKHPWITAIFVLFIGLFAYCWKHIPPPGYAVAALAVAAVIMAGRGPKFTRIEEVTWILIAVALFVVEIRAIRKDRADFARQEGERRKEENARFQAIADGLAASIKQSQDQFNATVAELSNNLNTLTGDDSFCYLAFTLGQRYLPFIHVGKFPLYEVSARIVELDQNSAPKQGNRMGIMGITVSVGNMIRGHATVQALPPGFGVSADYFSANVFFTARNGDWTELLRERRVKGRLVRAMRVAARFTSSKNEKPICETIDPEFPRRPNGDIDGDFQSSRIRLPRCP